MKYFIIAGIIDLFLIAFFVKYGKSLEQCKILSKFYN